jgi:hypothetical protein
MRHCPSERELLEGKTSVGIQLLQSKGDRT